MIFHATYSKHGAFSCDRRTEIEAKHGAHAQALAERDIRDGETLMQVRLASRATVEENFILPADHARNVAEGRRS